MQRYYWLDLVRLAQTFLQPNQSLESVKYFTARVNGDPGKNKRHSTYIDALKAVGGIEVIEGRFQLEPFYCSNCHSRRPVPKEKQTDTKHCHGYGGGRFPRPVGSGFSRIWGR